MGDRHQFRAQWHDYNDGLYFVTICTYRKTHIFGKIQSGKMHLTSLGLIVEDCIKGIPSHSKSVELWNYVVMPNHIHMVVNIDSGINSRVERIDVGAQYIAPALTGVFSPNTGCLAPPRHGNPVELDHFNSRLAVVVRSFKAAVTRWAKVSAGAIYCAPTAGLSMIPESGEYTHPRIWQRNYHENIIRGRCAYEFIMDYIDHNVEIGIRIVLQNRYEI